MAKSYPFQSIPANASPCLMIGAMSGTSADGVDAALVEIAGDWPRPAVRLLGHHARPYPADLKQRLFAVREQGTLSLAELAALARDISLQYAQAVADLLQSTHWAAVEVAAIAAHGQTLFHQPPLTLQWLNPAVLAHETGCRVISDFRSADCAAGGQGAPLVPFADWVFFAHPGQDRMLLNLGGIANLTYLPAGTALERVSACDTGPANCLSDWLCRRFVPDGPGYDPDGARALGGRAIDSIADAFLRQDWFRQPPPKSTDGPAMIRIFERAMRDGGADDLARLNDLLATAAYCVARCVVDAAVDLPAENWIVAGGGVRNRAIMAQLRAMLPPQATLRTTDALGMPWQAREAAAFAILGAATLAGVPSSVPNVTGAARPRILGSIAQ